MGFGITSRSSVRSSLSTALVASGMCFRSPRMYVGSRLALCAGEPCSQYLCASPRHVAIANVVLSYQPRSSVACQGCCSSCGSRVAVALVKTFVTCRVMPTHLLDDDSEVAVPLELLDFHRAVLLLLSAVAGWNLEVEVDNCRSLDYH